MGGSRNGIWPWLIWTPCLAGKKRVLKAVLNSEEMKEKNPLVALFLPT